MGATETLNVLATLAWLCQSRELAALVAAHLGKMLASFIPCTGFPPIGEVRALSAYG